MAAISGRADRVGYTEHIDDEDLRLTYMQARYYDPVLGRFMSNDPVGFLKGGPAYHNRYAYTMNNPINAVDPDGRRTDFFMLCNPATCESELEQATGNKRVAEEMREVRDLGDRLAAELILSFGGATKGTQFGQRLLRQHAKRQASRKLFKQRLRSIQNTLENQFNRGKNNGLVDAIRRERQTGELVGGRSHIQKGLDALKYVRRQRRQINNSRSLTDKHKRKLLEQLDNFEKGVRDALNG